MLMKDWHKYDEWETRLREGVDSVMGGRILEHESKTIYLAGFREGYKEGYYEEIRAEKQAVAIRMHKMGIEEEKIAELVDISVDRVRQWIRTAATGVGEH